MWNTVLAELWEADDCGPVAAGTGHQGMMLAVGSPSGSETEDPDRGSADGNGSADLAAPDGLWTTGSAVGSCRV